MNNGICFASVSVLAVLLILGTAVTGFGDAAGDLARGRELYEAADYDAAIQILNTVVSADAALAPEALKYISSCYYQQKKYPEAIALARKRVELLTPAGDRETLRDARGQLATACRDGGKTNEAIELYSALLAEYPEFTAGYCYGLGMSYKQKGEPATAADYFNQSAANSHDPGGGWQPLVEASACLVKLGRSEEADILVRKAHSDYASADVEITLLHAQLTAHYVKDYERAIPIFQDLMQRFPNNLTEVENAVMGLVECMRYLERPDEAIGYATTLYQEQPNLRAAALLAEGRVRTLTSDSADDYASSAAVLRRLLSEFPEHRFAKDKETRQLLVTALDLAGRVDQAVDLIKSFLPENATPAEKADNLRQAALAYLHAMRTSDARAIFSDLLANHQDATLDKSELVYRLAYCSYFEKDYLGARARFRSVCDDYPDSGFLESALYMVGDCSVRIGDNQGARDAFNQVISDFPDTDLARNAQERLLELASGSQPQSNPAAESSGAQVAQLQENGGYTDETK